MRNEEGQVISPGILSIYDDFQIILNMLMTGKYLHDQIEDLFLEYSCCAPKRPGMIFTIFRSGLVAEETG
jgi:hypothetical protein